MKLVAGGDGRPAWPASPQVIRHSKRMVARDFSGAIVHGGAAAQGCRLCAVALAETLLADAPLMGRAAVAAYDKAKAYAPDDDEGKMIEIVVAAEIAAASYLRAL